MELERGQRVMVWMNHADLAVFNDNIRDCKGVWVEAEICTHYHNVTLARSLYKLDRNGNRIYVRVREDLSNVLFALDPALDTDALVA